MLCSACVQNPHTALFRSTAGFSTPRASSTGQRLSELFPWDLEEKRGKSLRLRLSISGTTVSQDRDQSNHDHEKPP